MKNRVRTGWVAILTVAAMVLCCLCPVQAFAEESSKSDPRHSVVCLQTGIMLDGVWSPVTTDDGVGYPTGTAFFVGVVGEDPQFLITNQHVIAYFEAYGSGQLSVVRDQYGNVSTAKPVLRVYYDVNRWSEAYLIESDSIKDIALLKLDKPTDMRAPLAVGRTDDGMVGQNVLTIGYPDISDNIIADPVSIKSETDASITKGIISRLFVQSGTGVRQIQTDAVINHGNSGGPMVGENGCVIGVNTWGTTEVSDSIEQIYYAVDMSAVEPMLQKNNVAYSTEDDVPETKIVTHTVTFDSAGGSAVESQTVTENAVATKPEDPTSEEATFEGWFAGDAEFDFNTPITEDVTLTAHWAQPEPASPPVLLIAGIVAAIAAVAAIIAIVARRKSAANKAQANASVPVTAPARPAPSTAPATAPAQTNLRSKDDSGFRLQGLSGALAGKRFMVPVSSHLTIGRGDGCNIAIPGGTAGVSSRHCEVWIEGGQIFLMDLGSTYGTFVDPGTKLASGQPVRIAEGSTFWLGDKAQSFSVIEKRG